MKSTVLSLMIIPAVLITSETGPQSNVPELALYRKPNPSHFNPLYYTPHSHPRLHPPKSKCTESLHIRPIHLPI